MGKFYFWNDTSGLEFGLYEGKTPLAAYESLLEDAGYPKDCEEFKKFTEDFLENDDIRCKEVEERYYISIDNAEESDTIDVFDGFEHRTLEDAKQVIHDLKSDPENEYTYRIYKGHVTSYDKNEAIFKAYVLEVL